MKALYRVCLFLGACGALYWVIKCAILAAYIEIVLLRSVRP